MEVRLASERKPVFLRGVVRPVESVGKIRDVGDEDEARGAVDTVDEDTEEPSLDVVHGPGPITRRPVVRGWAVVTPAEWARSSRTLWGKSRDPLRRPPHRPPHRPSRPDPLGPDDPRRLASRLTEFRKR